MIEAESFDRILFGDVTTSGVSAVDVGVHSHQADEAMSREVDKIIIVLSNKFRRVSPQ
jgi:hypothetical protein